MEQNRQSFGAQVPDRTEQKLVLSNLKGTYILLGLSNLME